MIPAAYITEWGNTVGWPTLEQVEQDGGTCLHKLHLNPTQRYSEDLYHVRRSEGVAPTPSGRNS